MLNAAQVAALLGRDLGCGPNQRLASHCSEGVRIPGHLCGSLTLEQHMGESSAGDPDARAISSVATTRKGERPPRRRRPLSCMEGVARPHADPTRAVRRNGQSLPQGRKR